MTNPICACCKLETPADRMSGLVCWECARQEQPGFIPPASSVLAGAPAWLTEGGGSNYASSVLAENHIVKANNLWPDMSVGVIGNPPTPEPKPSHIWSGMLETRTKREEEPAHKNVVQAGISGPDSPPYGNMSTHAKMEKKGQRYAYSLECSGIRQEFGFDTYEEMAAFLKAMYPEKYEHLPAQVLFNGFVTGAK